MSIFFPDKARVVARLRVTKDFPSPAIVEVTAITLASLFDVEFNKNSKFVRIKRKDSAKLERLSCSTTN